MSATEAYQPPKNGFRTFVIIWATQSISVFGSALTFFALTIWLTQVLYPLPEQKPQLAFALSLIALCFGIPQILAAPIAGAWADRHDRKLIMMTCDTISGFLSLALVGLIATNTLQLWTVLILMIFFALSNSFQNSAFDTSYAMIVPEKQLPRANGMMQTVWSLSAILSPAIAAFIIALPGLARQGLIPGPLGEALKGFSDGTVIAITIDAITFFLAAAALIFLYVPSPKRTDLVAEDTGKKKSLWSDVKVGATYIGKRKPLLWLLATFTVINFATSPLEVFTPLLLKFNLAPDLQAHGLEFTSGLALISSAAGIGGLVGGLLISVWGGLRRKRIYGVVIPIMLAGVLQMVYGLSLVFYLTLVAGAILIGLVPIMNAHSQTIWQTQVPRELQGRVFSVRRLIAQFSAPLGVLLAGIVGGVFNPGAVLAVLGLIVVVFSVFQLFNPYLLRVEDKETLDRLAEEAGANAEANAVVAIDEGDISPMLVAPGEIYREPREEDIEMAEKR